MNSGEAQSISPEDVGSLDPDGGLDEEVARLLGGQQKAYEEGLERANPAPTDGQYVMQLRKVALKAITLKDAQGAPAGQGAIIRLSFMVLNQGPFSGYKFGIDLWPNSYDTLAQFAMATKAGPVPAVMEAYAILKGQADAVVRGSTTDGLYNVQIERSKGSKPPFKMFVNTTCLGKVRP